MQCGAHKACELHATGSRAASLCTPAGQHAAAAWAAVRHAAHPFIRRHYTPDSIQKRLGLVILLLIVVCQLKHDRNNGCTAAGATACRVGVASTRPAHTLHQSSSGCMGGTAGTHACRVISCANCRWNAVCLQVRPYAGQPRTGQCFVVYKIHYVKLHDVIFACKTHATAAGRMQDKVLPAWWPCCRRGR